MGVISVINTILEALSENENAGKGGNHNHRRALPADKVMALVQEGKREAAALLRITMGWSTEKALQYIEALKTSQYSAINKPATLRNKTSTQIDTLLQDHRRQENNGGTSLLEYFIATFKK